RLSRMSAKGTPFGAFLDSTLDRIEEGVVLTTVAAWFASNGNDVAVAACVVTVLGSLMVSYTRARAEALGVECKVGLATRPVRVVILSIGLLFAKVFTVGDFSPLELAIYGMALIGVGNCASSCVQGVQYYQDADPKERVPGLMHVELGGYHVRDIEFSAAFDIDADKVGKDLSEAIWSGQNNTIKFADVPKL